MASEVASAGRRPRWVAVVRAVLVALAVLVAAGAIYVRNVMKPRATPPPPLPSPNGHDDLVRAGAMIRGAVPNDGRLRQAKLDELRAWVGSNAEAMRVAREGLTKPSRVPIVYKQDIQSAMDGAGHIRALGRLFAAEGEIAAQEGRPAVAVRSFLDELKLGRAAGRGGLMFDAQVGWAIEAQALDGLARVRDKLPADAARGAITGLLDADKDRETYAQIRNAEDYWFEQTAPYMVRFSLRVSGVGEKLRAPADKATIQAMNRTVGTLRREVVALAQHLYALEKGAAPKSPDDLVPAYLPEVPKDPATGRPIGGAEPEAGGRPSP